MRNRITLGDHAAETLPDSRRAIDPAGSHLPRHEICRSVQAFAKYLGFKGDLIDIHGSICGKP
jgi:hypothetical protein